MPTEERSYAHNAMYQAAVEAARVEPTKHVPRLVTSKTGRQKVHGEGPIGRFNSRLAVVITKGVGTMWAAYIFTALALISFPQALMAFLRGDLVVGVAWVAQTFLQLVLLPIIIVGQNVISAAQDARAEADHLTLTALHTMNVQQLKLLEQQSQILDILNGKAR
jgi:hypothetical protein